MTKNPIARPAAATGFVALLLLVTACGGGSGTTATAATTTTTVAGRGARQAAFSQCMKQHGVTLPANFRTGGRGPGTAGGTTGSTTGVAPTTTIPAGVTPQQWQAAITACASQLPPRGNINNPQVQLYYNCLQSYLSTHGGTTLPPLGQGGAGGLFGGGGGGAGATGGGTTSTTNPTLQAARDHCAALRPTGGGGATTSTSIG